MSRFAGLVGFAGWVFVVAACGEQIKVEGGGGAVDAGADAAGPTQAEACSAFMQAYCSKQQQCWPLELEANSGDLATCVTRGVADCMKLFGERTAVTPAGLMKCTDEYGKETCADVLNRVNGSPDCSELRGPVGPQQSCASGWECAEGCCVLASGAACPVCTPKKLVGSACATSFDCDDGLLCSDAHVCAVPRALGELCGAQSPCRRELTCKGGHCAARGEAGAPCDPNADDCDGYQGLFCNGKTSACEALGLAYGGEPCGYLEGYPGSYTICVGGADCKLGAQGVGKCVGPLALGAACKADAFPLCAYPATCAQGQCKNEDSCP